MVFEFVIVRQRFTTTGQAECFEIAIARSSNASGGDKHGGQMFRDFGPKLIENRIASQLLQCVHFELIFLLQLGQQACR
jgi:hypothetical protein